MYQEFFANLPSEIIIDILSRLPVRTIINCKLVCKSWLDLVETHEFAKSHLSKSAPGVAVFQSDRHSNLYKTYEFEDVLDLEHHEFHYNPVTKFDLPYYNPVTKFDLPYEGLLQGSANGLLFLHDLSFRNNGLSVCNPITREYIQLQCPQDFVYTYPQVVTFGFGVSGTTGQHKVVRIVHDCICDQETHALLRIPRSECHVYTLGTGSWRSIAPGAMLEYSCHTTGAFLNGNLHWLVHDLNGSPLISCFDLETEQFSTLSHLPLPCHLTDLCALGDRLCLCDNSSDDEISIWLMKEYGVERSWTKEFVISKTPDFAGEYYDVVRPIKVFKDGDILMAEFNLFYYSSKSNIIREIDMSETPSSIDAILHISSFLSLKSFGVENVNSF